ncbi:PAAR domain-containing protein [Synechococcus elongatus]|uniref:PAAR domain-containing protein n=1 Tax=Synechococcus sp. (strain ATCC 27144 / PCC 6301 / SAUG 1402/1) TaxID=269084 RepID=A0A0H3K138_SYNP6|nr:PAAR domain-containing protein [Synechococcus elongatus]AJD58689.1 hypothetical protein M744_13050 [Synechococcus elongatus UTEX 2973]UOW70532.1 PaaR membrane protein [Synechococcus elongatus PCC 7943]UOW73253.1 PaaR membrane protein [Synechococcus elongatus PCC 6311]UOW75974.1 PaaR membrane protein [Synechococcus elongatus PCC 6301]WKW06319.1 PAAR domain-containing protein [Synechococcus elongatus PCC 7942 = FACHB-805]
MTTTPGIARLNDVTDHGGIIITGSDDTFVNSRPVARKDDLHACPLHGLNTIITGSRTVFTNQRPTARIGDLCSCGAAIIEASEDTGAGD